MNLIMKFTLALTAVLLFTQTGDLSAQYIWDVEKLAHVKEMKNRPKYNQYYRRLLREADAELRKPEQSVTFKPMTPPSGDKHDYMSIGRYWWPNPDTPDGLPYVRRDGQSNPELEKYDRNRLGDFAKSVKTLSLAYYLSDNYVYWEKACSLLWVWFLDPQYKMNPNMNFAQSIPGHNEGKGRPEGIIDTYSFVEMIDAIVLLDKSKELDPDGVMMRELRKWFSEYTTWMVESEIGKKEAAAANNHSVAYDVQLAIFAAFAGNDELALKAVSEFPEKRLAVQIEPDGSQPRELARTIGYYYSVFNLSHFLDMNFIAKTMGQDIYFSADNAITRAISYLCLYLGNESIFPYKQINSWKEVEYNLARQLRRAYMFDPKPEYKQLADEYSRQERMAEYFDVLLGN